MGARKDVSAKKKLRERNYLVEGLDESRVNEPEDVNVNLVGVNHVSVLSVHQDEADRLLRKLFKFDFKIIFIIIIIMIKVFTDGACSNNGKATAKAGLGVYFSENDPRNVSRRIVGKQSNNTAELSAVIEVFSILSDEIQSNQEIIIYSDSTYTIRWCGEYGRKCEANGWLSKKPIPNLDLGKELYLLCKEYQNVKLEHIRAHTGLTDELSLGNESADGLATSSITS